MRGVIGFEELELLCTIGVYEEERQKKKIVYIDVKMEIDLKEATTKDAIEATVDYGKMMGYIEQEFGGKSFFLIETLAARLMEDLLKVFKGSWIKVKVKKPLSAYPVKWAICEIERSI